MHIVEKYSGEEYKIQLKAPVLKAVNIVFFVLVSLIDVVEIMTGEWIKTGVVAVLLATLFLSQIVLRRGNYTVSARITSFSVFLSVHFIYMSEGFSGDHAAGFHLFGVFLALYLASFLLNDQKILVAMAIAAVAAFAGRFGWLYLSGTTGWAGGRAAYLMGIPLIYFLASQALNLLRNRVEAKLMEDSLKRYSQVKEQSERNGLLLKAGAEQFSRIRSLDEFSDKTAAAALNIEKTVQSMGEEIAVLREKSRSSRESLSGISDSVEELTSAAGDQSATVAQTGASIEEMVADEVRKLAESSSVNAKEIGGIIKELVGAIQTSGRNIELSGESFHEISREIDSVSRAMEEIAQSTDELSVGSGEILTATTRLNESPGRGWCGGFTIGCGSSCNKRRRR